MDDGNILRLKNPETTKNQEVVERINKKDFFDRYLRTFCESDVDIEKLTLDERHRFFTWRRTVIPREYLEDVVKKEYGEQLDTNCLIVISDMVKMFVGDVVGKCLVNVDDITKKDILRVVNTPEPGLESQVI